MFEDSKPAGDRPGSASEANGAGDGGPVPDDLFATLGDDHRQEVLASLVTGREPTTLDALAERVVAERAAAGVADAPVTHVRAALHHVHLPRMDAMDVVEYDADEHTVALTDVGARFEECLDLLATSSRSEP